MVAHNVVRINGTLPGGEVWSVTPKFVGASGPMTEYADLLQWAENIGQAQTEWTNSFALRELLSSQANITSVRTEYRTAAGELGQAAEFVHTSPVAGVGIPNKIFQASIVCSLLTGRPGRSYRGRIYWPALAVTLGTGNLRVPEAYRDKTVASFGALFREIEGAADLIQPMDLAVVSQTLGVATPVTGVQVGDIIDIQRRRRDSLQEFYSSEGYPSPT